MALTMTCRRNSRFPTSEKLLMVLVLDLENPPPEVNAMP